MHILKFYIWSRQILRAFKNIPMTQRIKYSWNTSQIFFKWVNKSEALDRSEWIQNDLEEIKIAYEALNATPQNVRKWTAFLEKFLII